jgi:hypothetical protein
MIERGVRSIATLLLLAFVVVGVLWSALALWFDGPNSHLLGATMSAGIVAASWLLAVRLRPFLGGLLAALLPVVVVVVWWTSLMPTNSRDWTPDVARPTRAIFDGPFVTIQNVRNFKYRSESDYDQR